MRAKLPTKDFYVVVNSKLVPEFDVTERKTTSILARTIGVALATELRAEAYTGPQGARGRDYRQMIRDGAVGFSTGFFCWATQPAKSAGVWLTTRSRMLAWDRLQYSAHWPW